MLQEFHGLVRSIDGAEEVVPTSCNKDTGTERRLQKWTRDVWFCVGGGGHVAATVQVSEH